MKTLSLLLLLFYGFTANAQSRHQHAVFGTGGVCLGNYQGVDVSVIYQYDERFSFQLDNIGMKRRFRDFYTPYYGKAYNFPIKRFNSFGFHFGYTVVYNPVKHRRISVKAGAIYAKVFTPYNVKYFPASVVGYIFHRSPHYDYDIQKTEGWGFSAEVSLELPIRDKFGFLLGAYLHTGKGLAAFGLKGGVMIGG